MPQTRIPASQVRDDTLDETDIAASAYATAVTNSAPGDAATVGTSEKIARQDHKHGREAAILIGSAKITVQSTAPSSPALNDLWVDTS